MEDIYRGMHSFVRFIKASELSNKLHASINIDLNTSLILIYRDYLYKPSTEVGSSFSSSRTKIKQPPFKASIE